MDSICENKNNIIIETNKKECKTKKEIQHDYNKEYYKKNRITRLAELAITVKCPECDRIVREHMLKNHQALPICKRHALKKHLKTI